MMTKVAKFTLCATILSLSYEIKGDVSSPLKGFQHLLCDKCNNTFDSTSQVVYISHLGVVQNVLTNPEKKNPEKKGPMILQAKDFGHHFQIYPF